MAGSATNSAIEVAYWFINKAEQENSRLEDEKLQHLLFLSQIHFALKNNMELLMPSLFVCGEDGFFEPNLNVMFSQGRPYMPPKSLPEKIEDFLGKVWKRYASLSAKELNLMIKSNPAYQTCYIRGTQNIAPLKTVVESFVKDPDTATYSSTRTTANKKVSYSQNGPVVVSQWKPRKISSKNN